MRLSDLQSPRLPLRVPRRLRASGPPAQDPDVFTSDLRRTLEAHRSSNRARLIRKIYPKTPPAGLFRPYIPPENRAGYRAPGRPAPTADESKTKKSTSRKHSRGLTRDTSAQSTKDQFMKGPIQGSGPLPEQQPWLSYRASFQTTGDATTYLGTEIQALDNYLSPSATEREQIHRVTTDLALLLGKVIPQPPQLIGSRRTGLALAHSNLNFLLPFEDPSRSLGRARRPSASRPQIQEDHSNLIRQVRSILLSNPIFDGSVQLFGKRKPILKARHGPTGLLLEFQCGEIVPAIDEYLQDYLVEYPVLRPLYAGARTLLEARDTFGAAKASIGSDELAILIVAFLKIHHGRFLGPHRLGDQFLALLRFYSADVDLRSVGVAVDPPGLFNAKTLRIPSEADEPAYLRGQRALVKAKRAAVRAGNFRVGQRLCIQDPTHYGNDLGRWCHRTFDLQDTFAVAYERLVFACKDWKGPCEDSSILAAAVRANFDELENVRRKIVRPISTAPGLHLPKRTD
ncbi:uncharacterized protein N7459_000733 [Penicillium hispanicum]|uniref:uncharacterized protein n=1 Tax=Penicillium hispanicum TaxID=1080232 RepID=UPI00253F786D|nr:uncharacterized protein N7459_000733 [Penicillium hispanicum]KAJ5594525.1 hypothetical protein N7459_000733 [Penicillium hispanicum]